MSTAASDSTLQEHPLDLLWQPSTITWTVLAGEAFALLLALAPGLETNRMVYFGLMSLLAQWVNLLALFILHCLRFWLVKLSVEKVRWIAVAALTLSGALTGALSRVLWLPLPHHHWWIFSAQLALMAGLLGVLTALLSQSQWRQRQLALRAKQAELDALRARVNPHFLFNSLNTAIALVPIQPEKAEQVLLDVSDLFRAALSTARTHELIDEFALVLRYVEIEQLRMGKRMQVEWHLPQPLPNILVPVLCLQPLVENAVRHGIEASAKGGVLHISGHIENDYFCVDISNPLPKETTMHASSSGYGVGLAAARTRVTSMQPPGRLDVIKTDDTHRVEVRFALRQITR